MNRKINGKKTIFGQRKVFVAVMLGAFATCCGLGACVSAPPSSAKPPSVITVMPPRGEPGDFRICPDGRVIVFPVSHPLDCS